MSRRLVLLARHAYLGRQPVFVFPGLRKVEVFERRVTHRAARLWSQGDRVLEHLGGQKERQASYQALVESVCQVTRLTSFRGGDLTNDFLACRLLERLRA